MDYPEIDANGEIVCIRTGSNYEAMLHAVQEGNALLIVPPPSEPAWWDSAALAWVTKPARPSDHHEWDPLGKMWCDRRTEDEVRAEALAQLRLQRNRDLQESDAWALKALEELLPPELRTYRQALRDLPSTTTDPVNGVEWPTKPAAL